jgi:protein phosphatase
MSASPRHAPPDLRHEQGPFDIIGDVHGCADEFEQLLARLGYGVSWQGSGAARQPIVTAPAGRRLVLVGDYVDRGPRSPDVLKIVMAATAGGQALAIPGNHDDKLRRHLAGNPVKLAHGLAGTVAALGQETDGFRRSVHDWLGEIPLHLWLDGGRLVVTHAGILDDMIGRADHPRMRSFCLYGDTSGRYDAHGLPERFNWAADYAGDAFVVYGHTCVEAPAWQGETVCIDTGCCFGGKLTALRWPEREIVSVPAALSYAPLGRPFGLPPRRPR